MKKLKAIQFQLALAILVLWVPGCATQNGNSSKARANTGYVDFRANSSEELSWKVARFDVGKQTFRSVFSELKPPQGGVLRLPFAPGSHRLQVTFLNRVVAKPAEIEVEVQDGKVTPILITMTEAGVASVRTEEESRGGTAKGRYGRRTKFGSDETVMYNLTAVAEPSVDY